MTTHATKAAIARKSLPIHHAIKVIFSQVSFSTPGRPVFKIKLLQMNVACIPGPGGGA